MGANEFSPSTSQAASARGLVPSQRALHASDDVSSAVSVLTASARAHAEEREWHNTAALVDIAGALASGTTSVKEGTLKHLGGWLMVGLAAMASICGCGARWR